MPSFQGYTDKVLKITLPSSIQVVRWGMSELAINGTGSLDVVTQWVADGSEIKVTLKDLTGAALQTLKGKVYSNLFRCRFNIEKPNETGGMTFEAELPAHHIKASSPPLRILPPVQFKSLLWKDGETGAALQEVGDEHLVACEAQVRGVGEGAEVRIEVVLQDKPHREMVVLSTQGKVESGKIRMLCKPHFPVDLRDSLLPEESNPHGQDYFHPVYFFNLECRGVSAKSGLLKRLRTLILQFETEMGNSKGLAGKKITVIKPDGTREAFAIPETGRLEIPKILPGQYFIEHSDLDLKDPD